MRFRYVFACLAVALATSTAHAALTIADNFRPNRYTATADQVAFAGTWALETDAQVLVYVATDEDSVPELQTLDVDYEVTGEGDNNGFTVTFDEGLDSGNIVILDRDSGVDRASDLSTIEPVGVNLHMNRQVMHEQETEDIARRRGLQIPVLDDYNNGDGDTWIENATPHVWDDVVGDGLCFLAKTNADDGYRIDFCAGTGGGGVCADCPPGVCDGGDNDGDPCASESDCPDGECVGFTDCDYISVADGTYVCETGDTCPIGCGDGGGGEPCLDCGPVGYCEGGTNDGNPCTDDADCAGGGVCTFDDDVCFGGSGDGDACTDDADCPEGGVCRPNDNVCFGGSEDGDACTMDADCPGLCTALACVGGPDDGDVCATNSDCATACVSLNDTCDGCFSGSGGGGGSGGGPISGGGGGGAGGGAAIPDICYGGVSDGDFCDTNADCTGGECDSAIDACGDCGGLCVTNSDCGDGCACETDNVCLGGDSDGDACTDDSDCPGGGVCAPEFTDETCQGGTNDGDPCTDDADCPAGGTCAHPDEVGVRGPTPPVIDNAVALWDGTSAAFIKQSRVTIGPTGFMRNVAAIQYSAAVSTATDELVTWQYPPTADQAAREAAGAWYEFPKQSPNFMTDDGPYPEAAQYSWVGLDNSFCSSSGRTPTRWSPMTYPVTAFVPGAPASSAFIRIYFTEPVVCPDNWLGSYVKASVAATAETTINLQKNNSTVGTAVFAAAGTTATLLTSGAATTYAAGDYIDVDFPASADATAANISVSLLCYRSGTDECTP
jgi:hypothetical protein